jgi:hypothetical protein
VQHPESLALIFFCEDYEYGIVTMVTIPSLDRAVNISSRIASKFNLFTHLTQNVPKVPVHRACSASKPSGCFQVILKYNEPHPGAETHTSNLVRGAKVLPAPSPAQVYSVIAAADGGVSEFCAKN